MGSRRCVRVIPVGGSHFKMRRTQRLSFLRANACSQMRSTGQPRERLRDITSLRFALVKTSGMAEPGERPTFNVDPDDRLPWVVLPL